MLTHLKSRIYRPANRALRFQVACCSGAKFINLATDVVCCNNEPCITLPVASAENGQIATFALISPVFWNPILSLSCAPVSGSHPLGSAASRELQETVDGVCPTFARWRSYASRFSRCLPLKLRVKLERGSKARRPLLPATTRTCGRPTHPYCPIGKRKTRLAMLYRRRLLWRITLAVTWYVASRRCCRRFPGYSATSVVQSGDLAELFHDARRHKTAIRAPGDGVEDTSAEATMYDIKTMG